MNITNIADRASSYGIPGHIVDGNDAVGLYDKMLEIFKYVREGTTCTCGKQNLQMARTLKE